MGRPPEEFRELAQRFVCARVTDMRGVDLEFFRFDFDLTFAALLMHPDGTIYHRFGGRDHRSPTTWVSMPALTGLMRRALLEHESCTERLPPNRAARRTIEDFPTWPEFVGERVIECAHCHQIGEHEIESAERAGGFERESIWRWPSPERVGLIFDPTEQDRVREVLAESPASRAGVLLGDRLVRAGATTIGSVTDLQAALDQAPGDATKLALTLLRDEVPVTALLTLPAGWKRGDARTFAWRPLKWGLSPGPGFGGRELDRERKVELGLDPERFALEITYLVTWGRRAQRGRSAAAAGLRQGDVVYAIAGKDDFARQDHDHAWFRLHRSVGEEIEVRYVRGGERRVAKLTVVP